MIVTAEPRSVMTSEVAPVVSPSGSIHIELPGRALVSMESGVDPEFVRFSPNDYDLNIWKLNDERS